ncbi:MAG: glycosyltransferase family 39 protein [Candidatus Moraniibacteriota bacterium]
MQNLLKLKQQISWTVVILVGILLIGTFLRTYEFHNWLFFGSDQVNDATRVGVVIDGSASWPLLGPDMSHSGAGGRAARFHLGPIYYYFEIISGKIFGNYPDKFAYPDLLFSILSIPLLYYFLRRFFLKNISLGLTGLYTLSFYILEFSHSAWNVNSIPFFVLLFLLSLYEFILNREKTLWRWVVFLGITLGVGVQLHAILLVLFPMTLLFSFFFFMRKESFAWKQWLLIIAIALFLNAPQIWSEQQTGFANTKIFFGSVKDTPNNGSDSFLVKFLNTANCHIQVNAYMISSIGQDACDFTIIKMFGNHNEKALASLRDPSFVIGQIFSFGLSFLGYGLLIFFFRREGDQKKKYFLGLVLLYVTLSFFVLLPVDINLSRYFVHVFFVPLLFLGFIGQYLIEKYPKKYALIAIIIVFAVLTLLNSISIQKFVVGYIAKEKSVNNTIILGEIESMVNYMIENSNEQKQLYLFTDKKQSNFIKSIMFIAEKRGYKIVRSDNSPNIIPLGSSVFLLSGSSETDPGATINDRPLETYKNFGQVGIYKIKNEL